MAINDTDRRESSRAWIIWLAVLAIIGWQLYLGVTIQEVGIPNVFSVKFGARPEPLPRTSDIERMSESEHMSAIEDGYDRSGLDYKDFVATDINQCLSVCAADTRCQAIAFNKSSKQCWMKKGHAMRKPDPNFISAVKLVSQP